MSLTAENDDSDLGDIDALTRSILSEVLLDNGESLPTDADLFHAGLTSLKMVQVVVAIEERLSLEIPDEMLRREHFRTIATLTEFVGELANRHREGNVS